jgi:prepilin-type N-terminal cleavage/methylation domain-containing protein
MNTPRSLSKVRVRSGAFTLIELLTVIAIIGILAAIIIPTVGRVRDTAQAAKTVSNLRQLQLANRMHAADYKGLFVPPVARALAGNGATPAQWYNNPIFGAYNGAPLINAGDALQRNNVYHSGKPTANGGGGVTLGIGAGFSSWISGPWSFHESEVDSKFPQMVMFADSCNWMVSGEGTQGAPESWPDEVAWAGWGQVAFRHGSKANVVLANGSVQKMSKAELVGTAELRDRYFPRRGNGVTFISERPAPY